MAQAAAANSEQNRMETANLLGENKALARQRPKPSPNPAGAYETEPKTDPLARRADRNERLNYGRQAARQRQNQEKTGAEKSKKEKADPAQKKKQFAKRNEFNDHADRFMILSIAGGPTALLALLWFNVKLFWGALVTRGQSRVIAPPSARPFRLPLLPDWLMYAAIIFADLLVFLAVIIIVFFIIFVIGMLIMFIQNPLGFYADYFSALSSLF